MRTRRPGSGANLARTGPSMSWDEWQTEHGKRPTTTAGRGPSGGAFQATQMGTQMAPHSNIEYSRHPIKAEMARPISTFPAELTKAGLTEAQVQAAMSGRQPLNTSQKSAFKKYLQRLGGKGPSAKIALPLLLAMGMFGMMGNNQGMQNAA